MNTDKLKGKANEVAGAAQKKTGEMTGKEDWQAKGSEREMKGKAQGVVGGAKDQADKAVDKAKDAIN